jgi:hypothetical protein
MVRGFLLCKNGAPVALCPPPVFHALGNPVIELTGSWSGLFIGSDCFDFLIPAPGPSRSGDYQLAYAVLQDQEAQVVPPAGWHLLMDSQSQTAGLVKSVIFGNFISDLAPEDVWSLTGLTNVVVADSRA